jgi:hypothetical protein
LEGERYKRNDRKEKVVKGEEKNYSLPNYNKPLPLLLYSIAHWTNPNLPIANDIRSAALGNSAKRGDTTRNVRITYSECVSVALVIRHAKRMRRIILSSEACLTLPYLFPHHLTNDMNLGKTLQKIKCVF